MNERGATTDPTSSSRHRDGLLTPRSAGLVAIDRRRRHTLGRGLLDRLLLLVPLAATMAAIPASAAHASFGVTEANFEAATCVPITCTYAGIRSNPEEAFTQAAGHPFLGITTFELNHQGVGIAGKNRKARSSGFASTSQWASPPTPRRFRSAS